MSDDFSQIIDLIEKNPRILESGAGGLAGVLVIYRLATGLPLIAQWLFKGALSDISTIKKTLNNMLDLQSVALECAMDLQSNAHKCEVCKQNALKLQNHLLVIPHD